MPIYYNIRCLTDNPSGIKEISNPTKTLKCLAFPRECLKEFSRLPESEQAGAYLLYNTADKNAQLHIYIGQSAFNIAERLYNHDKKRDFWNYALVFVEKGDFLNLNGTHAKIIESLMLEMADTCGVVVMDNSTGSKKPKTKEEDIYAAETWAEEIFNITKLLGLAFFEQKNITSSEKPSISADAASCATEERRFFYCVSEKKSCNAKGYLDDNGFVVMKGSVISKEQSDSFALKSKFEQLLREKVIVDGYFTQDYRFGAPSTAAVIVLGRSANGYLEWIDENGINLYEATGRGGQNA